MRAVTYHQPGPAAQVLQIQEMTDPMPGPGEVRVVVHYSAVNPTDVKRRQSEAPLFDTFQIPHHDGSGIIDQVGSGVSADRLGERVWFFHAAHNRANGSAAELICVPSAQARPLPEHCSMIDGAMTGIPMMTAAHALQLSGNVSATPVLITGAGGAVGSAAVSLARSNGAHVIACVSSEDKADVARKCGAHDVIIYPAEGLAHALETRGITVQAVIDVAIGRNLPDYQSRLRDKARVVSYSSDAPEVTIPVRPFMFSNATLSFFVIYSLSAEEINQASVLVECALAEETKPQLPVRVFDMEECSNAHEFVESRTLGRAIVRINPDLTSVEERDLRPPTDQRL